MADSTVRVTTARQSAARDSAAIAAGIASSTLMTNAAEAAAHTIMRHARERIASGIAVFAGSGNNGGDAWIVARLLRQAGATVRVAVAGDPSTDDARAARAAALVTGSFETPHGDEAVAVDGLLGTGSRGAPRGAVADALGTLRTLRERGAMVIALDIPSGLDATTGEAPDAIVDADVTVTFGTLKRGLLIARERAGAVEVADIGLGAHARLDDGAPAMLDAESVRRSVPRIGAAAHKGTRGRVAIVGGGEGMAGAVILAARAALRTGAGLVRVVVAPPSLGAVQTSVPEATASAWPSSASGAKHALGAPDAIVIGPGLGREQRDVSEWIAADGAAPMVVDADALNMFAGDTSGLRAFVAGRAAILTPHPAECGRLLGIDTSEVLRDRFDVGLTLARATNAVVVLKGTPTVISAPDGRIVVAPVGSPVLATGGSGDVLSGIAGALLAGMPDAFSAALAAVWAHGAAAAHVGTTRVRGATIADVVDALRDVWSTPAVALPHGILAMLPSVGER